MTAGKTLPHHVMRLPGGPWVIWRSLVLRGAGFPAREVLRLAAPSCAEHSERVIDLEDRAELCRRAASNAVRNALDELPSSATSEERRPLFKALRALAKGKSPRQELGVDSLDETCEALREARVDLVGAKAVLEQTYRTSLAKLSRELEKVASCERFREAVTWQNRIARRNALDSLVRRPANGKRNSQRRRHEETVASYLQRYAAKNETIGFFGPVGWARFTPEGEVVRSRPGTQLVARRQVYFENWCIDALAQTLAREPGMRPWLAPRLRSGFYCDGRKLHRPFGRAADVSPATARLLSACDGKTPAREIAVTLAGDPGVTLSSPEEVLDLLDRLCKKRIVLWNLEVPLEPHPERHLAERLARIGDADLRVRAQSRLNLLEEARRKVAHAAGDVAALDAAMRRLEGTFTELTGRAAQRNPGRSYASRTLVYEDCRRDLEIEFGPGLVQRLGPPLTLMLEGTRWLAGDVTRRVRERVADLYADLARRTGSRAVASFTLLSQALGSLFIKRQRDACFVEVESDYQARWSRVLGLGSAGRNERILRFQARELMDRATEEFGHGGPAWKLTRYLGPDIMIGAKSLESFERGDFEIVLGEMHAGNYMFSSLFLAQHPAPEELRRYTQVDLDQSFRFTTPVVVPRLSKNTLPERFAIAMELPEFYRYHFGDDPPGTSNGNALSAGCVVVEDDGGKLVARTRDGRTELDVIDLLGIHLSWECNKIAGRVLPRARHWPRIVVDEVVVSRERWSFASAELDFARLKDPCRRYLAARRWARRYELPRFCFYKVASEMKPCYLDLDSPIYVDLFARMLRSATRADAEGQVTITEMLPDVNHAWLPDAEGNRYTCELRTACYEKEGEIRDHA